MFAALSALGQGTILFQNSGNGVDAPVVDANTTFLAQLYAGPTATNLAAIDVPVSFSTNGYFFGGVKSVPTVPAGATAVVQVRVWSSDVATFEQAVNTEGSWWGRSALLYVPLGSSASQPAYLTGLQSFIIKLNFQAGTGYVDFANVGNGIDAPIFDVDGTTRLAGTNFLAQLYTGSDVTNLVTNGGPVPFTTNGYFQESVHFTGDAGYDGTGRTTATAQVRVWRAADGSTWQAAAAKPGAHLGASALLKLHFLGPGGVPLTGLESFSLAVNQGTVAFANIGNGIDAPVFAADGTTRLTGTNFLAQLYADPSATNLAAIDVPVPFSTNGYFSGGVVSVPNVLPGGMAVVQVRVWRASDGPTFEQASATADASFGASRRFYATLGSTTVSPGYLTGLRSFSLQTLLPDSYSIQFANSGNGIDAPIFDFDGTTRLAAGFYVAQLYAGFDTNNLTPEGVPVRLTTPGYFQGDSVDVGSVFPDPSAVVQVKEWRLLDGATFEQARNTAGAHWGMSAPIEVTLVNLAAPAPLTGLQSFRLSATPSLHFAAISRAPNGGTQLTVSGTPGQDLVVEYSGDLKTWSGLATNVLGNDGQVQLTDSGTDVATNRFYRARTP
ncbi:MAG: hypothetical protein ACYDH9_13215 [Limisphaerales bacterium]